MALIKNTQSQRLIKDAIVLDMGDLARQADRLLVNARAEAARILEQARREAQALIDAADARGYAQGMERGLQEGRAAGEQSGHEQTMQLFAEQLQSALAQWSQALASWEQQRHQMLNAAKEDVIALAFALAQRITHRLAATDPAIIKDQLAATLALLSRPTSLDIRIHPDDRALAEQALPDLLAAFSRCEHVQLHDDPSITRGGCFVTTLGGHVDATIQTQLDRIAEALVPARHTSDAPPVLSDEPASPTGANGADAA